MGNILKLAGVLTIVTALAGLAVALVYTNTKEQIELRKEEKLRESLLSVFPDNVEIHEKKGIDTLEVPYWVAKNGDSIVGYAFRDSAPGYSSYIKMLVGISPHGKIMGVSVISQNETPGLGTRVEEVLSDKYLWNGLFTKSEKKEPWFTRQFEGLSVTSPIKIDKSGEWHTLSSQQRQKLKNEHKVTAITGATISTRAVITALRQSIPDYYRQLPYSDTAHIDMDTLADTLADTLQEGLHK